MSLYIKANLRLPILVALIPHISCDEERLCYEYITKLRRNEFGVGVNLTEDGQLLMEKQQKRLGRSLDRLSSGIYVCVVCV